MNDYSFPKINLDKYKYSLPEELIAQRPSSERGHSRLLFYNDNNISHHQFKEIVSLLPSKSTLFFNDTKVIPARMHFRRQSGAIIEIFLLEPIAPSEEIVQVMDTENQCTWTCMIGNLKKWKNGETIVAAVKIESQQVNVQAQLIDREARKVQFNWPPGIPFSILLETLGKIPLPPYIPRETDKEDAIRYQTVYCRNDGAVAAPTAGLHFTTDIIDNLKKAGIKTDYLTLHVSAGTFRPISSQKVHEHPMHAEKIIVSQQNIKNILDSEFTIAVGTTSLRTLESLYWYGVKLLESHNANFFIQKDYPYQSESDLPTVQESLNEVLAYMINNNKKVLHGVTQIFIVPGYIFRIVDGLVTNYHMPGSTLILLVAAFIGSNWKKLYIESLKEEYNFLSYGDSSLLIKPGK